MNRIKYLELFQKINRADFENDYMFTLKLKKIDGTYTKTYEDKNREWKKLKSHFSCCNLYIRKLPNDIEKIITSPFEKLVDFLLDSNNYLDNALKSNLSKIFDYEKIKSNIYKFFNKYSDKLGLCRCPYCDSAFSGYYLTENEKNQASEKVEKSLYDLDHFIPKKEYPLFSISLYNFVPSCIYCNMRIKNDGFIDFYSLDFNKVSETKQKLLQSSPSSDCYNFENSVFIRYIPKMEEDWHYSPLSQNNADNYKVFFDTEIDSQYAKIIKSMKLEDRYNFEAIKMNGLYLMDLKKRYPPSHVKKIFELLSKSGYPVSLEQIENDIFHKDNKYSLLQKMRNDLLE